MDVAGFLGGFQAIDLLLLVYFVGFFVLGFAQGTIRRVIGIGAILFSFLLAANLAGPLGSFLGDNWRQFAREYSYMVGFGTIFFAAVVAFALVAQGFYRPQPLFEKARFVDEIIGGILGLVEAAILLAAVVIILDSFFLIPGIPPDPQELPAVREVWMALDGSGVVDAFRATLIPGLFTLVGLFIPSNLKALYPGR